MNIPNTMMRKASSRRGAIRSARRRGFIIDGGAVVASPCLLGPCAGLARRRSIYLRLDHRSGASRSASLSASCAPSRVSTLTYTDMPARSRFCLRHVLRHADAHRHALHDLGEIAGRVVRRQQREHRARRRRHAVDDAVDLAGAEGIDRDLHRLARPDALELGLLEIRVDVDLVERHDVAEPLAGLDVVAGIDHAVGEDAVHRRAHAGEFEIALGLGKRGLNSTSCARASACCALTTSTLSRAAS